MGFGDFFRKFFGRSDVVPPEEPRSPLETLSPAAPEPSTARASPPAPEPDEAQQQALFAATCAARDRRWQSIGTLEADVISYLISPGLTGGPDWPTVRQAYRVIRTPTSIILATDGMADPFDDEDEPTANGFEMELFIETSDIPPDLSGTPRDISALKNSWAFALLEHVANVVADVGGIAEQLERHGSISAELPGMGTHDSMKQVSPRFITSDQTMGVILGAPSPPFRTLIEDTPVSPVRLVPIVLLTAAELDHVCDGDDQTRRDLVERLSTSPTGHVSDLNRESLV